MIVKLGDVAFENRENWTGSTEGVPIVGLEHLTPGEITLKDWTSDLKESTFTKKFRKGQVLLGRRRVYLRKAALAPFDGICSGDITVIESNPAKLLPELLPFIIQNDEFFDYAMKGSAGSLSPRVKWVHLTNYTFNLPSLPEQKRLADLLWAANDLKESYKRLLVASDEMAKSRFVEMFGDPIENAKGWPLLPISSFANIRIGPFGSMLHAEDYIIGGHPVINPMNIADNTIIPDDKLTLSETKYQELSSYQLKTGDVIIGRRGEIGRSAVVKQNGLFCGTGSMFIRIIGACNPVFLQKVISYPTYKAKLENGAVGVTMKNLNAKMIADALIPLPPMELQTSYLAFIEQLDKSKVALQKSIENLDVVIHNLISNSIGGNS